MEENLNKIVNLIENIKKDNDALGDILAFNFNQSLNEYKAFAENKPLDISGKITLITNILGISIEDLVTSIIDNKNINNSDVCSIKNDDAPDRFSEEEYQKFLEELRK